MQCIGRAKTLKRCKKKSRRTYFPFCNHHWWQPFLFLFLTIPGVIGVYAGIYRDIVEPLTQNHEFNQKDKINDEYLEILDHRANSIRHFANLSIKENNDSNMVVTVSNALQEFDSLHSKNMESIKNNNLILSHEITGKIHRIPKEHKLIEFSSIPIINSGLDSSTIWHITQVNASSIWLATESGGIVQY